MPFRTRERPPDRVKYSGELRVMQKLGPYEFGVELWLMRDGRNRNKWDYRNLERYYLTFVGQPILCAYIGPKVGDGHNMAERIDPSTGEKYYSFTDGTAERIVGTLSDDPKDFTLVERDGHTWIVAKGKLYSFYARELVDKIVRAGRMDVSSETLVEKEHEEDGYAVFTEWTGIGVTILGDDVSPAIPSARIAALKAMQEEFKTLKLRAASLNDGKPQTKQNPKKGVKRSMNKKAAEQLAPKFEGYKIVALSEDGLRVGLIDQTGAAFTYVFNSEDNGEVVASRIKPCYLTAAFHFDAENEESVDVCDICEHACASVRDEKVDIKALRAQLESVNNQLAAMQETENKRRMNAAKTAVTETLNAFNRNREDKIGEDALAAVSADVEAGVYANSLDKDGNWIGEKLVRDAVLAVCGAAVMAADERRANAKKTRFIGERLNSGEQREGVASLLEKWGIETTPQGN